MTCSPGCVTLDKFISPSEQCSSSSGPVDEVASVGSNVPLGRGEWKEAEYTQGCIDKVGIQLVV